MKALVSIIVPVYNLEGYIDNCLKSLVNQTYQNLEVLCIDDGSTDSSGDRIKAMAEKDSRIIYIKKENGGVSSARNLGLDMFKGDYLMFVDGDDFLHPQAVEIFVDCIEQTGCDIACANIEVTSSQIPLFDTLTDVQFSSAKADDLMLNERIVGLMSSCCKLYSRDSLQSIRFNETLIYSEDTIFLFEIFLQYNNVAVINKVMYYYFHRQGSATRTQFKVQKSNTLVEFSNLCDKLYAKEKYLMLDQMLIYMFKFILTVRTQCFGLECYKTIVDICNEIGKKWLNRLTESENIDLKTKMQFIVFFYSRHLYELARLITDPTMKDFYKNRRKHNSG